MPSVTPSSTSPSPPALTIVAPSGLPDGWVTVTANDGSFTFTGPGPADVLPKPDGFWELDSHAWEGGSCVVYLYYTGDESDPSSYARGRLLSWVAGMSDPHERPTHIKLGSAVGWRTEMSYEDGSIPVGAFQVLYREGWEYSMGCSLSFTHPKVDDSLTTRFLDSFRAPA